tara:strand:+ start:5328 stop:6482 length:1155 start_codon:yes stop_codon:yes gene_type:complete
MKEVSAREKSVPKGVIQKLLRIAAEEPKIISLGPGEPDFETPKPILKKVNGIIRNHKKNRVTHYAPTEGLPELREGIARKLRKENGIKGGDILVSTGSQSGIFSAFLSCLDPGDEVIVPNPGYMAYVPGIDLVNAKPVYVSCLEKDCFAVDPDKIKKKVTRKTRVLMLNTPANPTGTVLSKKLLEEIADIAVDKDLYVFSDEAYEKLVYDDKKHVSIGSFNGMRDYVVSFFTFSKSYAMCGFRLGYCHGPKEVIKAMGTSIHYMTISAPHISQKLAIEALKISDRHVNKMKKEYDRRRRFIVNRLNGMGLKTTMPDGTFYAFSNIKKYSNNSSKFADMLLKKAKVAVLPGTEFGKYGEGFVRFSYATDLKLIKKAMDRIEKVLK